MAYFCIRNCARGLVPERKRGQADFPTSPTATTLEAGGAFLYGGTSISGPWQTLHPKKEPRLNQPRFLPFDTAPGQCIQIQGGGKEKKKPTTSVGTYFSRFRERLQTSKAFPFQTTVVSPRLK